MKTGLHFTAAAFALLASIPLQASSLLSDNTPKTGSASYPGDTSKVPSKGRIATGVTYSYLTGEAANTGIGNTDPDIVNMSKSLERLLDGYNERVGNTAIYGAWRSQHGATIVFDLKQIYGVDRVSISVREDTSRGAATFQAFVSTDGVNYSPLGRWDGSKITLDSSEPDPGRNTEISIAAPAPAKARYLKIYLSHWNETHTARLYHQLVIGEVAIWGDR